MRERWHRALLAYSDEANGERILVYEYMHSWSLEDKNLWHANWSANMIKHLLLDSGVKQLSECFLCFQTDRNTKERALLNWRRSWHGMADGVKNEGEGSAGNVMHRVSLLDAGGRPRCRTSGQQTCSPLEGRNSDKDRHTVRQIIYSIYIFTIFNFFTANSPHS